MCCSLGHAVQSACVQKYRISGLTQPGGELAPQSTHSAVAEDFSLPQNIAAGFFDAPHSFWCNYYNYSGIQYIIVKSWY